MGTWGAGVYENDTAADYLLNKIERLINDIRLQIRYQTRINAGFSESEILICDIDLLTLLCEKRDCSVHLPATKELEEWEKVYMNIWEGTIDDTNPTKEYKKDRRKVLNQTFGKLISLSGKARKNT